MFDAKNPNAPKIVCDISEHSVASVISTMRTALAHGADAFHLNVSRIDYRSLDDVAEVFQRISVPIFTSNRRAGFSPVYGDSQFEPRNESDDERMSIQLRCLTMGSVGIDMEMDTFHRQDDPVTLEQEKKAGLDPERGASFGKVGEVSFDPSAVAKQRDILKEVKKAGCFSILSSHTARPVSAKEACLLAQAAADRGADFFKLVVRTRSEDDQDEVVRAALELRRTASLPFVIMPMGQKTLATRAALFLLGGAWVFAQPDYVPTGFDQQPLPELLVPLVRALRSS